jgi:UDP-N-acetylmuramoylalanine--D-glutamate ligase
MSTTGESIYTELVKNRESIYKVETLEEAVKIAKKVTRKNKICLLSPAASSYNQFKNFEERGRKYKELILNK